MKNTNAKNRTNKRKNKFYTKDDLLENSFNTKFLIVLIFIFFFIFIAIIARLFYWQFINSDELKQKAYQQQSLNEIITPKRGNIYDTNGKALAISAEVDTITINPGLIVSNKDGDDDTTKRLKTKELKEKYAKGLSEIFDLNYDEVLEKLYSNSNTVTIAEKVEKDKVDELNSWMDENNAYVGINIDTDSKRTYPYNTTASHLLGFVGKENNGLAGIEADYNSILTGIPGKILSYKSNNSSIEIPDSEELKIDAQNGSDITLTIDVNLQTIAEKYLKEAVDENNCENGGNVIMMDPKTGDILAMASYPNYDPNNPYTPNEQLAKTYDSLNTQDQTNALFEMWRNKSVNQLYEPGSVFKIITSAVALEEIITTVSNPVDFNCQGFEKFSDGTIINCWSKKIHGYQDLRQALINSCNPAFMQLGRRIGKDLLYKYYKAFGLMDKTNVGIYEENPLFIDYDNVREVELATMSFGQRLNITPLQMITAISAIANDGILLQPRLVKATHNNQTNVTTQIPVTEVRQVVSKSTADSVKSMMLSVVENAPGNPGYVKGYEIGGKTGTSEPLDNKKEDGYTASFVAISPIENTQVVILLTLYKPTAGKYHGGEIAAPAVAKILNECLPYLTTNTNN